MFIMLQADRSPARRRDVHGQGTIHSFIHGAAIGARPVRRRQRVSLAREFRNLPQRQTTIVQYIIVYYIVSYYSMVYYGISDYIIVHNSISCHIIVCYSIVQYCIVRRNVHTHIQLYTYIEISYIYIYIQRERERDREIERERERDGLSASVCTCTHAAFDDLLTISDLNHMDALPIRALSHCCHSTSSSNTTSSNSNSNSNSNINNDWNPPPQSQFCSPGFMGFSTVRWGRARHPAAARKEATEPKAIFRFVYLNYCLCIYIYREREIQIYRERERDIACVQLMELLHCLGRPRSKARRRRPRR